MGLKVGNDLKLYYNSGTHASPVWNEVNKVGDVTVNININEAEVDLRISNWVLGLPSKLTGSIDVSLANDIGGTVYDVLRAAALARTQYEFASANGTISTSNNEYFYAFCYFSAFPWGQGTQDLSMHDATLSFGYTEESGSMVEPGWAVVP